MFLLGQLPAPFWIYGIAIDLIYNLFFGGKTNRPWLNKHWGIIFNILAWIMCFILIMALEFQRVWGQWKGDCDLESPFLP